MPAAKNVSTLRMLRIRWRSYRDYLNRTGYGSLPGDLLNFLALALLLGVGAGGIGTRLYKTDAATAKWAICGVILAAMLVLLYRLLHFLGALGNDLFHEQQLQSGVERFEKAIAAARWVWDALHSGEESYDVTKQRHQVINKTLTESVPKNDLDAWIRTGRTLQLTDSDHAVCSLGLAIKDLAEIPPKHKDISAWVQATGRIERFSYIWLNSALKLALKDTGAPLHWTEHHPYACVGRPMQFVLLFQAITQTEEGAKIIGAGNLPNAVTYFMELARTLPLELANASSATSHASGHIDSEIADSEDDYDIDLALDYIGIHPIAKSNTNPDPDTGSNAEPGVTP